MKILVLLPPDYRAECFTVRNIIAIGHHSGSVSFIEFDLDKIPSSEILRKANRFRVSDGD